MKKKSQFFLFVLMFLRTLLAGQTYLMSNTSITTCAGSFYDSGGLAGNYGNSENFTMTIYPSTPGLGVSLSFISFNLENNFEQLEIYDGTNTAAQRIIKTTSTISPISVSASTINPTGALTIRFTSDGGGTRPGWEASISCVTKGTPIYSMMNGTVQACGGLVYDSGGPNANYGWNDNLTTTYCAPTGSVVSLSLSSATVEPLGDVLRIYDGPNTSSPLMATYHNSGSTPGTYVATPQNTSGCITLSFVEDGWTLFRGWSGTLTCVPPTTVANYAMQSGTLNACSFRHFDPGGPYAPYTDSQNIVQVICSNSATDPFISMTFTNINIENNIDRLRVYNGTGTLSPLLANLTGTISGVFLASSGGTGCLTLWFTSNANSPASGWTAQVSCFPATVLPVELVDFRGELVNKNQIRISWFTLSEHNSWKFEVQRSTDGINYSAISETAAAGFSKSKLNYSVVDTHPIEGVNYYRLKKIDKDLTYDFSPIIAVIYFEEKIEYEQFPNPFTNDFKIKVKGKITLPITYSLINALGMTEKIGLINELDSDQSFRINADNIEAGVYQIKLQNWNQAKYLKIIKSE